MDNRKDKLQIVLIGPYPPPYGGVSIHIQRLQGLLLTSGIQCVIYDVSPYPKNTKGVMNLRRPGSWLHLLNSTEEIVHIHNSGANLKKMLPLFALLKFRGKKAIITYHSLRDNVQHFNWFKRKAMQIIFDIASHYIVANPEIKMKLLSLGASAETISVIPAFLPPTITQQEIDKIPQEVLDFINSHSPVISAGAFRITFYEGQDLYGIDMCIELCANLKNSYPQIGFVFCLPNVGDYDYLSKMKREIRDKNIENNFLFITQPLDEVYPIWRKSDIFVRPTVSDGDAVSLREALYLKTPSVASDVVLRPKGTVLFKNRNMEDFVASIKMVWDNYDYYKAKVESIEVENGLNKILKVYSSLANKRKVSKS